MMSGLKRIPDSGQTSRRVRKVPIVPSAKFQFLMFERKKKDRLAAAFPKFDQVF